MEGGRVMGWGTACYLPWVWAVWLQIDGPLMESQAGSLDHFAVPAAAERERERVRELEGGREGGWVGSGVGGQFITCYQ